MLVKIQKRNSGVIFIPLLAGEKLPAERTAKNKPFQAALRQAEDWYRREVIKAFEYRGVTNTGYYQDFLRRSYTETQRDGSRFMALEPVGFAHAHMACEGKGCADCGNTGVGMNNMGSTPTVGRARVLACYQSPLKMVKESDTCCRFEIVKNF